MPILRIHGEIKENNYVSSLYNSCIIRQNCCLNDSSLSVSLVHVRAITLRVVYTIVLHKLR